MPIDNDLGAVEKALIDTFTNALTASSITGITKAKTKYPNRSFTTPNNDPWARLSMTPQNSPISTDASGCYEINQGVFNVGLFWPKGTGTTAAMTAAHQVKELYETAALDDVTIGSVTVNPTSEPESSNWYGVNVNITYQYEGHRS